MRKLLFANIGAAAALGVGAMGVTIAVTHKIKSDQAQSENISSLNSIFNHINNLYNANNETKEITESNYNSLYTFIQQSIAGTVASITNSTNQALALQRADLLEELKKVQDALAAHSSFDEASFADIYTAIAGLNTRLESIDSLQSAFESKLELLTENYKSTTASLWQAVGELQASLTAITDTVSGNYVDLNNKITAIQNALLKVDELRNLIYSTITTVQTLIDRVTTLEGIVSNLADQTGYDKVELQKQINDLKAAKTLLETKVTDIETAIQNIWAGIDKVYNDIELLKGKTDIHTADIAQIKADIAILQGIANTTQSQQQALSAQFTAINNNINTLFNQNAQLQTQIDYLNTQNNLLYSNFLYLQSLVNDLQSIYGTGGSTTVSIKPDLTDIAYTIYDSTSSAGQNGSIRYPSINVTNLSSVKRFAIYVKVWAGSIPSYETQIIDAYPNYDLKMIGSSTQGFGNEQFLVSIGLDKNINKININGVWSRKSSDSWKQLKNVDNFKVQITNIVLTY